MSTREDIINQLVTLCQAVSGIQQVYRNRDQVPKGKLPAIVILDNREELGMKLGNSRDGKMPPALFDLWPQIWVALKPRDTVLNETLDGTEDPIGPEISYFRDLILDAVCNDPTLLTMVTANGFVEYRGMETDMAIGSSMKGNVMMQFVIRYVLVPTRR